MTEVQRTKVQMPIEVFDFNGSQTSDDGQKVSIQFIGLTGEQIIAKLSWTKAERLIEVLTEVLGKAQNRRTTD